MSTIQFFDHNLYRKVQYFEWALLAIAFVGEIFAWWKLPKDPTSPNIPISLFLLTTYGLLSFFTPLEGTFWDRLCFLLLQTILITGATAAGNAKFVWPLYTVVVARGCLILDRRGLWITSGCALVTQILWESYKLTIQLSILKPDLVSHGLHLLTLVGIAGGALVLMYVPITALILVAMLTLLLVKEQKSRQETERLSSEVEALATELERSRIAREIHDSLGHTLTTLNIQLDLARRFSTDDPAKGEQALKLAKELATQSLNDVRLAVQSIRNANFDLKEAVAALVTDVSETQPLEISLPSELPDLPPAIGFQLFRVIQECLTNVIKHANASHVTIAVARKDKSVELEFADNGCGLQRESGGGYGIKGMQERVESMRGSMSIRAEPDQGTHIQVTIPL